MMSDQLPIARTVLHIQLAHGCCVNRHNPALQRLAGAIPVNHILIQLFALQLIACCACRHDLLSQEFGGAGEPVSLPRAAGRASQPHHLRHCCCSQDGAST